MKKTIAIVASIAALAYVSLAFAEENAGNNQGTTGTNQERKIELGQKRGIIKAEWEQKKEQWKTDRENILEKWKQEKERLREEFKEKFTEERCARIQKRIEERTSNFDEREGKHKKVYENLVNRINKFITRFETANLDTANLKSYLATLQEKIDKFSTDYAAYIAKLKESKNFTCGHSEGEFKGVLVDARAELKLVHEDAAGIRTYMRDTIIPEIKALKDKMPKNEEKSDDNDAEGG
jgi:chromosome segregation ATPase